MKETADSEGQHAATDYFVRVGKPDHDENCWCTGQWMMVVMKNPYYVGRHRCTVPENRDCMYKPHVRARMLIRMDGSMLQC